MSKKAKSKSRSESFEQLVFEIISLAQERHFEDEQKELKSKKKTSLHDDLSFLRKRSPAEQALLNRLNQTTHEEAEKLEDLMYLGRDSSCGEKIENLSDFQRHRHSGPHGDHQAAIMQIFEKLPLAEYLKDGLEKARSIGLDLESSFDFQI